MNHPATTDPANAKPEPEPDDDPFYKGANLRHLEKSLAEWNDPNIPKITKTMEELEAMANDNSPSRHVDTPRPVVQPSSRPVTPQTP